MRPQLRENFHNAGHRRLAIEIKIFRQFGQAQPSGFVAGKSQMSAIAGERSAVIYTLLGSCRRQGINPFDYMKDLFTRLPAAKITQIKEFTPAAWAKATTKERVVLQAF